MSRQPRKRRRIDSKEGMKSMMNELVGEMVPVIVDLVTSKLSEGSTVQTGTVTQSQEQDSCGYSKSGAGFLWLLKVRSRMIVRLGKLKQTYMSHHLHQLVMWFCQQVQSTQHPLVQVIIFSRHQLQVNMKQANKVILLT